MDRPQEENGKCNKHPKGCGRCVDIGSPCRVDGNECVLLDGKIWQISVRMLDNQGEMSCKIGVTRVLWYNLALVTNRIGVLSNRTYCKDEMKALPATTSLGSHCYGSGTLKFIDGPVQEYKRPGNKK